MQPIWKYHRIIRMKTTNNQAIIKDENGEECQRMQKMLERWEEWTKEFFSKEQKQLKPMIEHITEQEWEQTFLNDPINLQKIRDNAVLTKIMKKNLKLKHG